MLQVQICHIFDAVETRLGAVQSLGLDSKKRLIRSHMPCQVTKPKNTAAQSVDKEKRWLGSERLQCNHRRSRHGWRVETHQPDQFFDGGSLQEIGQKQFLP